MTDKVLVTGGCGVLGSAIVYMLREWGVPVVVIDDLSRSSRDPDPYTYIGDFADHELLSKVFLAHPDTRTVIHAAAYISPTESVREPALYNKNNFLKTGSLMSFLEHIGVDQFIFSSSAAVYGDSPELVLSEFQDLLPASPYALSKELVERELAASSMRSICFRYFNPITGVPGTVLHSLFQSVTEFKPFWVNGDNWGTSDGSPIRDFVSVQDLALAHVRAVSHIGALPPGSTPINIGSGKATSLLQLIKTVERVTGLPVPTRIGNRRDGDIRGGAADIGMALRVLNWKPRVSLEDSVAREWDKIR